MRKIEIAKGVFELSVECPAICEEAQAGQFLHIRVAGFSLRRPISICAIDRKLGTLRLVFEVRGEGTAALARVSEGERLDLLGPLGKGFAPLSLNRIVVGGGIGVPPLLAASGKGTTAILGFRTASAAILAGDFQQKGCDVRLATDDGSLGHPGLVTELLARRLEEGPAEDLCACGPLPMLKAVVALAERYRIPCQVSLEERMACGVGACLVCACKTVREGREVYSHVCKDGPVFDAKAVVLE